MALKTIALSGFDPGEDEEASEEINNCWRTVAKELWTEGATLAYAGGMRRPGFDLVQLLIDELSQRSPELNKNERLREEPKARFLAFVHGFSPELLRKEVDEADKILAERDIAERDKKRMGVEVVAEVYLDDEEQRRWGEDWRARTVERFRRRLAVSEASVARFVIGGHLSGAGRPSGIIEEAIQSLALKRPIYLAGGFGRATATYALGVVLGLSGIRTVAIPESLRNRLTDEQRPWLEEIADQLRPPPLTSLPVSPEEQLSFLRKYALGGPLWPNNGLTLEENRELFRSNKPEDVKKLIISGLKRVFSVTSPADEDHAEKVVKKD
jgi:hypothetical protein